MARVLAIRTRQAKHVVFQIEAFPHLRGDAFHDDVFRLKRRQQLAGQGRDAGNAVRQTADRLLVNVAHHPAVAEVLVLVREQVLKTKQQFGTS